MFSLGGIQPQIAQAAMPLNQLGSILQSLRVACQSARPSRSYGTHKQVTTSGVEDTPESTKPTEMMYGTLRELGLTEVTESDMKALSPLLSCLMCQNTESESTKPIAPHWSDNYTSAETFFENKYGFTERELWDSTFGGQPLPAVTVPSVIASHGIVSRLLHNPAFQQTRGFKTRRPSVSLGGKAVQGFGRRKEDDSFSAMKYLRESVLDRMSGTSKRGQASEKLKTMLTDHQHSPEVQDKLKIAFAEGYSANDKKEADAMSGSWARRLMRFAWYGLLLWLCLQLIQGYSAIGGNMKINVLKGERYEVNPEDINVCFDDVKGVDEAKSELQDVVEFLRDPDRFKVLGAKLPKGVLLVGPPGIGKTLLARAVAGEAGVPFFHASGSEFDEIFVGTGAKRVRQLFDAAKARAPCVIFIDEIDTVGAKRTSSQIHPYANQTINQLLSEMDGFQQNEGVIVLGATNRRDNLDKALLRPGRFDVEVRVFAPDLKGRRDILNHYLVKIKTGGVDVSDIDTEKLAKGTTGCTGADLENIVNQAALKAAIDGADKVSMTHMDFAKDKVLMGPVKKTKIPDEETNLMTACHEAGHTLVAYYTKEATPLHKVTIVPRGMSLGHTSFVADKEEYNQSRAQLLAAMDVAMGGRVAEELVYGMDKVTTGASSDFRNATRIATAMVKMFGMSDKVGVRVFDEDAVDSGLSMLKVNEVSPATTELVDNEIKRLLQESYERAKNILKTHSAEHKALSQALMKYETLDAEDIKSIVEGKQSKKAAS